MPADFLNILLPASGFHREQRVCHGQQAAFQTGLFDDVVSNGIDVNGTGNGLADVYVIKGLAHSVKGKIFNSHSAPAVQFHIVKALDGIHQLAGEIPREIYLAALQGCGNCSVVCDNAEHDFVNIGSCGFVPIIFILFQNHFGAVLPFVKYKGAGSDNAGTCGTYFALMLFTELFLNNHTGGGRQNILPGGLRFGQFDGHFPVASSFDGHHIGKEPVHVRTQIRIHMALDRIDHIVHGHLCTIGEVNVIPDLIHVSTGIRCLEGLTQIGFQGVVWIMRQQALSDLVHDKAAGVVIGKGGVNRYGVTTHVNIQNDLFFRSFGAVRVSAGCQSSQHCNSQKDA